LLLKGELTLTKRFLGVLFLGMVISMLCLMEGRVFAEPTLSADGAQSFGEVKVFSLQQREVVAIAVDANMPTASITDPLSYKMELHYSEIVKGNNLEIVMKDVSMAEDKVISSPYLKEIRIEKNIPSGIKISMDFPGKTKPLVTTVKRKRFNRDNGTTDFRTYLVLDFSKGLKEAKIIVLDPGHGSPDPGAVSNFLCEKDLNLDISLRAQELFRQKGYDVYMTRTEDIEIPLFDRADAANILNAAVFISVHNNSMPLDMSEPAKKIYRGTTVLYNGTALKPAKELAIIMCDELVKTLRTHKYPLQDRPGLLVLNSTWVPAVIAEVSMMPHPQDAKMISQPVYRLKAAEGIVTSTEKYLNNPLFDEGR